VEDKPQKKGKIGKVIARGGRKRAQGRVVFEISSQAAGKEERCGGLPIVRPKPCQMKEAAKTFRGSVT